MPILHAQAQARGRDNTGNEIELPPVLALQVRGPVLQVSVSIELNAAKALSSQGKSLPTPKSGLALIDTGASQTCVDDQSAAELGLPVIDVGYMISATHERVPCNVFPLSIVTPIMTLNSPRTMGASLASHGLLVLIGRDVLMNCTLHYNGANGQWTLAV
jgi:predicted aspartyl protease